MEASADTNTTQAPAVNSTSPNRPQRAPREDIRSPRRGRGRGDRGQGRQSRGRGRGAPRNGHQQNQSAGSQQEFAVESNISNFDGAPNPAEPTAGNSAVQKGATTEDAQDGVDTEAEICFICASPIIHNAVAPCNHRTCHICALRLRALYKTKACAHCRTQSDFMIFTDDAEKNFEGFVEADFAKTDPGLGIKFEKNEIFEDTVLLLRYNCPEPSCDVACFGWGDLHRHVKEVHHRVLCKLCTRNKKVFTHEHDLFTYPELRKHEKFGDDNPGAIDQSGFKGHPECGFCRERFYDSDELYAHCRDKHERCHVCDRLYPTRQQQYYLNYDQLEVHFRKDHFLCADQECLDKKFVVFESEMDLKAHQLETHPNGLSKDARKDARRVDMSGFDYRSTHQESRGDRREGRGRGRGRDPNSEPLPMSSAQPMRRDEIAYQRQLAIHSAQSTSNRTFGSQLTSSDGHAARATSSANQPATVTVPSNASARPNSSSADTATPPLENLNLNNTSTPNRSLSPVSQVRAMRHAAVQERASNLLGNDSESLSKFRNLVSSYRNSSTSASRFVDSLFELFGSNSTSTKDLGTLIKELADIFEIPGKKEDLLKAWNDWRAINEDYPSLPGPNGVASSAAAATNVSGSGKRILKLKSSTAPSSRSAVSRSGSWGGTSTPVASSSAFPPMPSASSNRTQTTKVPWTTGGSSSAALGVGGSALRGSAAPSASVTRPAPSAVKKAPGAEAFPALPAASKPGMNVSRPGYLGTPRLGRASGSNTPINAWGGGGIPVQSDLERALEASANEAEAGASGKAKGKGKGKKVYMAWG